MRVVIEPGRRIAGSLWVPGDKSISHRALLVGSIGRGQMQISGLSPAEDVRSTESAIGALGISTIKSQVSIEGKQHSTLPIEWKIIVNGKGWEGLRDPDDAIDCGNSGSTIRMLLGIVSGSRVHCELTGDASLRGRPMRRVVEPLRRMGADIEEVDGGEFAPLRVRGRELRGVDHVLAVSSAQVKSALLLAGLRADGMTSIREPARSRDHTERLLKYLGVHIDEESDRLIIKSTNIFNDEVTVPGDLSSAAFLLVGAAILPGSEISVEGVGLNPTRTGILDVLRAFGAEVVVEDCHERCGEPVGTVTVRAADRRPVTVEGDQVVAAIDELPLVAVLGAAAEGETVVRDAAELRVKESDRIAAIVAPLAAMGVDIEALPDGFVVRGRGGGYTGARVDPRGDHRIAMAMAVAGLAAAKGTTTIEDWECVGVSYPGFERDLERLVVR